MTPPRGSSMTTWHYRCEPELLDRNKLDPIPGLSEDETVFPEKSNAYYPPKNEGDKTRSPGRTQPNSSTLRDKASIWRFLCCSFGRGCALGLLPSATDARPHRQLRTLPASQNVASHVTSGNIR